MLNGISRHKFQDISRLIWLEGKQIVQTVHYAMGKGEDTVGQFWPLDCRYTYKTSIFFGSDGPDSMGVYLPHILK